MDPYTRHLVCIALMHSVLLTSVSFGAEAILAPAATQWKIKDVSENKDLSGIACVKVGAFQRCVIAVDEGVRASIARMEGTEIRQERLVTLVPSTAGQELDAEGVAFDPDTKFFYIVGSHGRSRHCCEDNPSAFNLIRFKLSESGDLPAGPLAGAIEVSKPLAPALKASAQVGPHVGLCLGTKPTEKQLQKHCQVERKKGANIEGVAFYKGNLYLGFRGPVHEQTAYLMRFDANAVFSAESAEPIGATIPVSLGSSGSAAIGIRELAAIKTGLLILSGPEDDDPGQAGLFHFDPDSGDLKMLGRLSGLSVNAKPEGLLVLEDSDQKLRVLVISDGVKNGEPTEYEITR